MVTRISGGMGVSLYFSTRLSLITGGVIYIVRTHVVDIWRKINFLVFYRNHSCYEEGGLRILDCVEVTRGSIRQVFI